VSTPSPNPFPARPAIQPGLLSDPPASSLLSGFESDQARLLASALASVDHPVPRVRRRQRAGKPDLRSSMVAERAGDDLVFRRADVEPAPITLNVLVLLDGSWSVFRTFDSACSCVRILVDGLSQASHRSAVIAFSSAPILTKAWDARSLPAVSVPGYRYTDLGAALALAEQTFDRAREGPRAIVHLGDGRTDFPEVRSWFRRASDDGVRSLGLHLKRGQSAGEDVDRTIHSVEEFVPAIIPFLSVTESEVP
jgi:von Willebrand factor type A domain